MIACRRCGRPESAHRPGLILLVEPAPTIGGLL